MTTAWTTIVGLAAVGPLIGSCDGSLPELPLADPLPLCAVAAHASEVGWIDGSLVGSDDGSELDSLEN